MSQGQNSFSVKKLYSTVVEDVMTGVREAFLDDGVDEQVLQELKLLWESKLAATKATEPNNSATTTTTTAAEHPVPANNGTSQQQSPARGAFNHPPAQQPPPQQQQPATTSLGPLSPDELIPIQITMPVQDPSGTGVQRSITIQVPASCIHTNKLQEILTLPTIQATLALPSEQAAVQLQKQVNQVLNVSSGRNPSNSVITHIAKQASVITSQKHINLDGGHAGDSSDEEDEEEDDDDDMDDDVDDKDDERDEPEEEHDDDEEPLNSEDDVSDNEDSNDKLYEIDNVVVCQYDKITRTRNKWKFHLKDGIMNLNGKDYVFQKANGDAEW